MLSRLLEIGGDLHVLAATDCADLVDPRDLLAETHAAGAVNAAGHDRLDQWPHILLGYRALVFFIARTTAAISNRLILKVALAALIANWAIKRVIDQQEFHHAFTRGLHHRRIGADLLTLGCWQRAACLRFRRSRLHLDQTHAAVSSDTQPFVIAEARNFLPGKLAGLQDGRAVRSIDFLSVYGDFGHYSAASANLALCSSIRRSSSGRKWRINPWIGHAAASPNAQMV